MYALFGNYRSSIQNILHLTDQSTLWGLTPTALPAYTASKPNRIAMSRNQDVHTFPDFHKFGPMGRAWGSTSLKYLPKRPVEL